MEARGRPRKQGGASGGTGGTAARRRYACLLPPRRIARTTCRGGAPPGGAPFGTEKCVNLYTLRLVGSGENTVPIFILWRKTQQGKRLLKMILPVGRKGGSG